MDFDIFVGALELRIHEGADRKKHRNLGRLCTKRRLCCHHAYLVYQSSFDIACDVFATFI